MNKRSQLPLILATAFLDMLGLGIFIPVLPDIIANFGIAASWSGYTQGIYALGMFMGWLVFWGLSDRYGRKKMLVITSSLNLLWYMMMLFAVWQAPIISVQATTLWWGFGFFSIVFLISRWIGGLGWAGFWVVQAYISDISSKDSRTKNMGLMGAMFGLWFLIGPALGALLSNFAGIAGSIVACTVIIFLNVVSIIFFLQEPKKHIEKSTSDVFEKFSFSRDVIILFILTFWATVAFSSIQSMSGQYYKDVFAFTPREIWFTMAIVGWVAVAYQWYFVRFVRKICDEIQMIHIAFFMLTVSFFWFALNTSVMGIYFWVIFFPLGMGSFHPSVGSLLGARAGREVGKVMGYNTSVASIGQIAWPVIMGTIYAFQDITFFGYTFSHYTFPFLFGFLIFIGLFALSFRLHR